MASQLPSVERRTATPRPPSPNVGYLVGDLEDPSALTEGQRLSLAEFTDVGLGDDPDIIFDAAKIAVNNLKEQERLKRAANEIGGIAVKTAVEQTVDTVTQKVLK